MSDDFTIDDNDNGNNVDDFQEMLDGIELSPILPGKRGGGRKTTNNIGADVIGVRMLDDLRNNHNVDLTKKENLKGNFLYGVIDQNSYSRAVQISRSIKVSYPQVGVLAMSITQNSEGEIYLQLWKGTIVNSILTFQKVYSKSKDYRIGKNSNGQTSFWRTDNNGKTYSFSELGTIVSFEDYLNSVVEVTELPVSFPSEEIDNLKNLSEILASVNLLTTELVDDNNNIDEEVDFDDEEVEE